MRRTTCLSFLLLLFSVFALQAAALPQLFQKAKDQFRLGAYNDALVTLSRVESESRKPENESSRTTLLPSLAFYRGACLSGLGRDSEAREQFEVFLAFSPSASLDPGLFPKKVIAALEAARRERTAVPPAERSGIAAEYRTYRLSSDARDFDSDEGWAEGPVRPLLSAEERRAFSQLGDSRSRSEFVISFWRARDPRPETTDNEFRDEFEKRVAFADSHFSQDEVRGSLTDRGMVFVLLGPPTYIGRNPITPGQDSAEPSGMSIHSHNDVVTLKKTMGSGPNTNLAISNMTGPGNAVLDSADNWREVWHYRHELLPKGVPYQQVDFEFISRKGYGKNILQREDASLNTLDGARKAIVVDKSDRPSS